MTICAWLSFTDNEYGLLEEEGKDIIVIIAFPLLVIIIHSIVHLWDTLHIELSNRATTA